MDDCEEGVKLYYKVSSLLVESVIYIQYPLNSLSASRPGI